MKVRPLIPISNVKHFLLEKLQLALFEVLLSDVVKLTRNNIMVNHFLDVFLLHLLGMF